MKNRVNKRLKVTKCYFHFTKKRMHLNGASSFRIIYTNYYTKKVATNAKIA
jgi:hypothetical protein